MHRFITSRVWRLSIAVILLFTLSGLTVTAQDPDPQTKEGSTAEVGPPILKEFERTAEPPTPTEEQRAQLEYWAEHANLLGPAPDEQVDEIAGPVPGTESIPGEERIRSGQPLAPGDAQLFRKKLLGYVVPPGFGSNSMSSSVGLGGKYGFFTGDWFAANTAVGGGSWSYVNPFADMTDFCGDQIAIYDEARDIFLWLRRGCPDWVGGNYENRFRLGVSRDAMTWWFYDFTPLSVDPGWINEWWDFPHIQLGADYAYLSWNLYNDVPDWTRTVMLRFPLDALAANTGFTYWYDWTSEWFTWIPVQGAYHTMYWASNWPTTGPATGRLGIWRLQEDETILYFWEKAIAAWTYTWPGDAHCPLSGPYNWLGLSDHRVLTGARYSINSPGVVDPKWLGRKVLGWWWNVAEGGGFPLPYIEGAAFFEDDLTQVPGLLGRPYIWTELHCFAYPSLTPNKRQDLGAVFHYAEAASWRPFIGYAIADDYAWAPPGWVFYKVWNSMNMPFDNRWGRWNTVREYEPTQKTWVAASHRIKQAPPACTNCSIPVFFIFGRERDYQSWYRWRAK